MDNSLNNSVDCIFDINGTHTLAVVRPAEPYRGLHALPGGRVHVGESLENALIREVLEETSIAIKPLSGDLSRPNARVCALDCDTFLDPVRAYSSSTDPRGGISVVYAIPVPVPLRNLEYMLSLTHSEAKIVAINELPAMAFDHNQIIKDYFKYYRKFHNPIPTTDIIIEYCTTQKEGIVLIERKNPPYGLAIPGGFAEYGISLEDNARKEALEETGLDIELLYGGKEFCVKSDPKRDPRGPMISVVYIAEGHGQMRSGDDAKEARLYTPAEVRELIEHKKLVFDHAQILTEYLDNREKHGFGKNSQVDDPRINFGSFPW